MNIRQLAQQYPHHKPLMVCDGKPLYWEFFQKSLLKLVTYFKGCEEKSWALCVENQQDFLLVFLALLLSEKQPILLPNYQIGTREAFREEYDALITSIDELPMTPSDLKTHAVCFELCEESKVTFFTSGSTGTPQKIVRKLGTLMTEIAMLEKVFGKELSNKDVYTTVGHQHIYGLIFACLWPFLYGRTVITGTLLSLENFNHLLKQEKSMVLVTSPTFLAWLKTENPINSPACVFSSGSLLKSDIADHLVEHYHLRPYEILGSTETSAVGFRQQCLNTYWQAFPEVVLQTSDTGMLVTSPYFDGEKPMHMGDKLELLSTGHFALLGREDRVVKVEGKRLSLSELENKIKENPFVKEAYSFLKQENRDTVNLALVLKPEAEETLKHVGKQSMNQEILSWLSSFYDPTVRPRKIYYLSHFPRNTQGKLIHDDLMAQCEENP